MLNFNKTTKYNLDFERIFSITLKIFRKRKCEVNVYFVTKKQIQQVNMQHRGMDKPTDVLSFQNLQIKEGDFSNVNTKFFKNPQNGNLMLGEIMICEKVAKEQAKEYGHSLEREFCYLFTHGLLHLFGFDHLTDADKMLMREFEEKIMQLKN